MDYQGPAQEMNTLKPFGILLSIDTLLSQFRVLLTDTMISIDDETPMLLSHILNLLPDMSKTET